MLRTRITLFPAFLLLAIVTSVAAEGNPDSRAAPGLSAEEIEQAIYKGFVGNVLDAIPMDPSKRANLQRTNAIISNTASGRSLAVLAGLSNPALLIGGFVWGVWAAMNIKPEEAGVKVSADLGESGRSTAAEERLAALIDSSSAEKGGPASPAPEPISVVSISAADLPRAPVMKIWLPQRSTLASR